MELTAYQEEALVRQYDKVVWQTVHRFSRRMHGGYKNKEDLHSECMIVLIRHFRSCKTMEQIPKIPIRDMVHAMCNYVLGEQAVAYPKRTSDFKRVIDAADAKVEFTEGHLEKSFYQDSISDSVERISFGEYVGTLSPQDQKIIAMKLRNYKNREIAEMLGMTDVMITRSLQRLRKYYEAYMAA